MPTCEKGHDINTGATVCASCNIRPLQIRYLRERIEKVIKEPLNVITTLNKSIAFVGGGQKLFILLRGETNEFDTTDYKVIHIPYFNNEKYVYNSHNQMFALFTDAYKIKRPPPKERFVRSRITRSNIMFEDLTFNGSDEVKQVMPTIAPVVTSNIVTNITAPITTNITPVSNIAPPIEKTIASINNTVTPIIREPIQIASHQQISPLVKQDIEPPKKLPNYQMTRKIEQEKMTAIINKYFDGPKNKNTNILRPFTSGESMALGAYTK